MAPPPPAQNNYNDNNNNSSPWAPPPVTSKAKDYRIDRPFEVQNELDDLRNRGLAKVLNRHFTDTTKQLAKEKAAADAALADLQRRRAQTSEFVPSKGGDLSPFDAMYVELQQKRAECRRKERETLLLYQRYVHKFGKVAPKPTVMVRPPPTTNQAAMTVIDGEVSPATLSSSTSSSTLEPVAPPPASPVPVRPKLEPLDENSETTTTEGPVDSGINFSRFYNHNHQHMMSSNIISSSSSTRTDPPTQSLTTAEQEVPELEDLTEQPSHDEQSGVLSSGVVSTGQDPPEQEDILLRRDEDGLETFVVRHCPPPTPARADPPTGSPALTTGVIEQEDESRTPQPQKVGVVEDDESSVEKSTVTPLVKELFRGVTIESCATTSEAARPVVQQPPLIEAALVKTTTTAPPPPDRLEMGSEASDVHRPTREVTAAAAVSDSEDDADDRSVISGLTMGSQVTKQVMEDIETEMTHFLNTETQAIRKLLDEEEERTQESSTAAALNASVGDLGDETQAASLKAEALAKEMLRILDQYKGGSSTRTVDTVDEVTVTTVGYPKEYETSDPTKNWMVYYDEKIRREYFFETNSKMTQWDPPDTVQSVDTIDPSIFAVDRSPRPAGGGLTRSVSRRDLYRKKMRKKRLRRLAAASLVTLVAAGTVYHWQRNHMDKTYSEAMVDTWQSSARAIGEGVDATLYVVTDTAESIKEAIEQWFLSDSETKERTTIIIHETEMERNSQTAKDDERSRLLLEAERRPLQSFHKEHEEAKKEETPTSLLDEERQAKMNGELISMTTKETVAARIPQESSTTPAEQERRTLHRPIGCFVPLASHIHPRCRKLATLKPMFKDIDILNSFMQ